MYTVPNHFFSTFFKIAVCLFDARRKFGVTSRPILLGTFLVRQRATFLRRLADLFSQISSGRRILMNNPGQYCNWIAKVAQSCRTIVTTCYGVLISQLSRSTGFTSSGINLPSLDTSNASSLATSVDHKVRYRFARDTT